MQMSQHICSRLAACLAMFSQRLQEEFRAAFFRRNVRIILVQMKYPSSPFPGPNLPVGLGYLAEQLEVHKIPYAVTDLSIATENELFSQIARGAPEYVGLSLMSLDLQLHYALAHEIKARFPRVKIVAGGAHVSFVQTKALEECFAIDFGVVHEGEQTLLELLNGRDPSTIRGLLCRNGAGEVVYTGHRALIENLDQIPFPRFRKFQLSRYGRKIALASSRGCPFSCTFCGAFLSMGRKWRARSVPHLVSEIAFWKRRGYGEFDFVDSNFFMSKERVIELCNFLEEKGIIINISSDGMRARDADRTMLLKLKRFGLQRVAVGIESANDDILRSIKKGETVADLQACMDLLDELGISVIAFFIIGLPGETVQHVFNSFKFALKYHNIYRAFFFNPNPLPGTEFFRAAKEEGILKATETQIYENIGGMGNDFLLETPELPQQERVFLSDLAKHVSRIVELNYIIAHESSDLTATSNLEKERNSLMALVEKAFSGAPQSDLRVNHS